MGISSAEFRRALGAFATGVTIITVSHESPGEASKIEGMTANAFTSVSLDPPLVLVCVDHDARTHAHLHARKRFGINVLAESHAAISKYYADPARTPSLTHDRAEAEAGARFSHTQHGTPILDGAIAYLECRLQTTYEAGDHTIFIAEVEEVVVREGEPLIWFRGRYRKMA